MMGLDWIDILETTKDAKRQFSHDSDAFLECVESKFQPCYEQLLAYAEEMSRNKIDSVLDSASMKKLVLQTRAALRFGLCCTSSEEMDSCSEDIVPAVQSRVVVGHHWCEPLASILTYRRGDKKCRTFAARLMSNLVTSNAQAALTVSSSVGIAPSAESISSSIFETVPDRDNDNASSDSFQVPTPNWVDMFLSAAKSRNREAVAAIAAALHNCISSLSMNAGETIQFLENIGSDGLLISTLLRHFVSAESITKALESEKSGSHEQNDQWDPATEWIQLLLSKLAKLGMLPKMYASIGTTSMKNSSQSNSIRLVPEQNILLHCMLREVNNYVMEFNTNNSIQHPFGGEEGPGNATYVFLTKLLVEMSPWFSFETLPVNEADKANEIGQDDFNQQLMHSGFLTVMEILATTLGVDNSHSAELRLHLGQENTILKESAKYLGVVLDDLAEKSVGRKARDIQLTKEDQKQLITLVQFIGNLCYRCKHNQDLLRTTLVPRTKNQFQRVEVVSESENSSATSSNSLEERNGLHILLTCTTHATACFSLREWGVIAIRNVLEDNSENQAVVENLMAQGTVESGDLDEAGLRVQLDSKGKVSLSTIDET